jgi:single-strand DNA-binding protein
MMQASVYGRLGQDPKAIETRSGKPMAVGSVAVDLECRGAEEPVTQWVGLVAFGRTAEELLRHGKGDLLSAAGRVQLNRWTGQDGEQREQLQVVADAIVSARAVRPGGARQKTQEPTGPHPADELDAELAGDEIPF